MTTFSSKGTDKALNIVKELKKAKKMILKVGIQTGAGNYPTGETIVSVGAMHEFGTTTIPRRSFLRAPFIVKKNEIDKTLVKAYRAVGEGKTSALNALNKVGVFAQSISKSSFTNQGFGKWTALKPSTIEAKGSSQTLIDTGQLRQSISWKVEQ